MTRAVLESVEEAPGVRVEAGDIVLVGTGQVSYFLAGDVPMELPASDVERFLHSAGGLVHPVVVCRRHGHRRLHQLPNRAQSAS
ncbi:hypothetical protein [Streptomyces sp. NPDC002276]